MSDDGAVELQLCEMLGKWNMDGKEAAEELGSTTTVVRGVAPSLESTAADLLRLTALRLLAAGRMDELGQVKAARKLGIDRKTLWRCRRQRQADSQAVRRPGADRF